MLKFVVGLTLSLALAPTQGQIQIADTLHVNIDATVFFPGCVSAIPNHGILGGCFEARGGPGTMPTIAVEGGTCGIRFDGNDYMQLVGAPGASLTPAPAELTGANATRTIEVWAFNPGITCEETMVSWGKRGGPDGSNMSFNYGLHGAWGAVGHWGWPDLGWDDAGGAPAPRLWHHLVYTFDGTMTRIYSDGVQANAEELGAGVISTHAGTAINLATQLEPDGVTPTSGLRGSLTLGRVRIHDGVLSAWQVLNNYNFERSDFVDPPPVTPEPLAAAPIHRYSFNEAPYSSVTFHDSIGSADGEVRGGGGQFSGSRLILPGGSQDDAAYGDLPNGLLSGQSAENGGSGQISIEGWVRVTGAQFWSRIIDFGSTDLGSGIGGEVFGPGGGGSQGLDHLFYTAMNGINVNERRLELRNDDPFGGGGVNVDLAVANFNSDLHFVITWDEASRQIKAYENGEEVAAMAVSARMSDIHDVNVWLGRSNFGADSNLQGEFDEFRIYAHVLSPSEVLGTFQSGPDVVSVADHTPPAISCPPAVTVQGGANVPPAEFAGGSVSDDQDPNPTVTFEDDTVSGSCPMSIVRTYKATDASGNFSVCQQTITVCNLFATDGIIWHQPLARSGASEDTDPSAGGTLKYRFKAGSTIPIRIHLLGCDGSDVVDNPTVVAVVEVFEASGCEATVDGNPLTIDDDGIGGTGGLMDNVDGHLMYNLDTKLLPPATSCYLLQVTVTDTSTGESFSETVPLQAK